MKYLIECLFSNLRKEITDLYFLSQTRFDLKSMNAGA